MSTHPPISASNRVAPAGHIAATPVSLTPIEAGWAKFCLRVHQLRPYRLNASNSPAALQQRVLDTDALIIAMADVLKAIVEDTAQHCYCDRRPDDIVEAFMHDMGSDLRGMFLKALESVRAA